MRTLLIDNHDSYTFNLYQLLAGVNGDEPVVVPHDDGRLRGFDGAGFDAVVVSPGPGRPSRPGDLGHVGAVLARTALPVLGVCLGHQAIAHAAGAEVGPAPEPRHGHPSRITHAGDALFAGIPAEFTAVRYHSLAVHEPLPAGLAATAHAEDGVVMALRHRELPRWGVQFHPESIASEQGRRLLANFRDLAGRTGPGQRAAAVRAPAPGPRPPSRARLRLATAVLERAVDAEAVHLDLHAAAPDAFWLDSSRAEPGLARFSFLGDAAGPLSEVLTYEVGAGGVHVRDAAGQRFESGTAFDVLDARLRARALPEADTAGLPFDFTGGYVGWFGYEAKADCGAPGPHRADTPDAAWIFADRLVAVDHEADRTYVLAVHADDEGSRREAEEWAGQCAARIAALTPPPAPGNAAGRSADPEPYLVTGRAQYLADIAECRRHLVQGESYEICLTTAARLPFPGGAGRDTPFYRRLRRANPAPYAALLRLGGVTVLCSSPERFLRIGRDGRVTSKPIKGTCRRDGDPERDAALAAGLAADPKTRAENLMIVDLLRNDLGRVCEIGSVRVDPFLAVESYRTVHQLVSTVHGVLAPGVTAVDCLRRCFPGGSMTGAPKLRTMEIIDRLEPSARGIYSGTLGYFGLSGGADLNIVIRTAVRTGEELSVGAGGAIVLDSDPAEEFDEMLLKASAPLLAWADGGRRGADGD